MKQKTLHSAVIGALAALPTLAAAQATATLSPVVVTATRSEAQSFDIPVAIDVVTAEQLGAARLQTNISEALNRVPGLVVQNRETFAQEQQVTLRGFGARSQFGIRGIRLLADGIPASTPDGQGGAGLFDLASADRVEVLRGAFSSLYGNHSGGVIQVFTEDPPASPTLSTTVAAGSFGTWKAGLKAGASSGPVAGLVSMSRTDTNGYRAWSDARKDQLNAKLKVDLGGTTSLTVVANQLDQPANLDPLGLTSAEMAADRRQASASALKFRTRRSLENSQGGAVLESRPSGADTLRAVLYAGRRANEQFLAVPVTGANGQNAITSAGAVSTFDRDFGGMGLRWTRSIAAGSLSLGSDYDVAVEQRRGYRNGITTAVENAATLASYGTVGALKRDETNRVAQSGVYLQGEWKVAPRWRLDAGVRYTRVSVDSKDHFICRAPCSGSTLGAGVNPDDSGGIAYSSSTPTAGVTWQWSDSTNLYASAGRSFETPTMIELAYQKAASGLNFNLRPSTSRHAEVGVKSLFGGDGSLNLALFDIATDKEIVVEQNVGGRTTYTNAGRTQRRGVEGSLQTAFGRGFGGYLAVTYLQAHFRDDFLTCQGAPCIATTIPGGNAIPGIPKTSAYGELTWRAPSSGMVLGVEGRAIGRTQVNDTNTDYAAGYFIASLRASLEQKGQGWKMSEFIRVDNLFDREYVGAVYVNDANRRFFAPAPGRNYLLGASLTLTM